MATVAYVGAPGGIKAGTTADHVDIGYYLDPTIQTRIELVCTFESTSDTHSIMGTYYHGNGDEENLILNCANGVLGGAWWSNPFSTGITIELNKTYTIQFDLLNGSQKISVNGQEAVSASRTGKIKNTSSFYLFAHNGTDTTANTGVFIKSFKIWENNVLIKSLDPYVSNNAKGFHDSVTDKFYQMSPSSVILDANKTRKVKEIYVGVQDYLESTQLNNYLNTGQDTYNGCKVIMEISFDELPSSDALYFFGNYTGGIFRTVLGVTSEGKIRFTYPDGESAGSAKYKIIDSPILSINTKYIIEAYWSNTSSYIKVNGNQIYSISSNYTGGSATGPVYLFNRSNDNSSSIKAKIYGCKIYHSNTLLFDGVPYGNGIYDNVSGALKTGNGTFIQGPQLTRKVKRGYVGVGNKTRIFYRTGTYFSSSIVPTAWGTTSTTSNFSASNNYGTWNIYSATNAYSTTYALSKAFDTSSTSYFRRSGATSTETEVILTAPEGIHIKPEKITARLYSCYDPRVYGSNDGSTYTEISYYSASIGGATDVNFVLSGKNNTYYRYFKLKVELGDGSTGGRIYDFKIPSGWVDKD